MSDQCKLVWDGGKPVKILPDLSFLSYPGAPVDSDKLILPKWETFDPEFNYPSLPYSKAFKSIFQGQTGIVGLWAIWAELLCIPCICHRRMTHFLCCGHLVWIKELAQAAAAWKSIGGSESLSCCRRKRRTLHTFEGHCTSKNGASPELTLMKAPVLEASVWAAEGVTSASPNQELEALSGELEREHASVFHRARWNKC